MEFFLDEVLEPATAADVLRERERRLAMGFDYDFGDYRGVHRIGTSAADMIGWDEVTKLATARKMLDDDTMIVIATDTGPAPVFPTEWLQVLDAAGRFRQPIWQASFVLQAQDPIPVDYRLDKWWP